MSNQKEYDFNEDTCFAEWTDLMFDLSDDEHDAYFEFKYDGKPLDPKYKNNEKINRLIALEKFTFDCD